MLTKKQEEFFQIIVRYYQDKFLYPSLNDLKKLTNYKSYNTIYKYLNILETKGYIIYNKEEKKISYIKYSFYNNKILKIPIMNENDQVYLYNLKKNTNYIAFRTHNNRLNNECIKCLDILIIEKDLNNLENKLVLVLINDKYRILKYQKKDSFIYLLDDYQTYFLTSFDSIIGKVCQVIRSVK